MRLLLIAFLVSATVTVEAGEATREYVSREHGIAISFPGSWTLSPSVRNEVWLASGDLRGVSAGCFVRVSSVPNLRLTKPDDFFAQMDENAFVKLNSITTPDIRVHLYDFSYLGRKKARRIIYSGTDEGLKVGNLVHQTLDRDRIFTVTCFTEQQRFNFVYGELEVIPASFRFLDEEL